MKLKIERKYLQHLHECYMPRMLESGKALANIYPIGSREYLVNKIAVEVITELGQSIAKKLANTSGYSPVLSLTSPQALALYCAMVAFPISPGLEWDCMKRDSLVAALHKWQCNPEAPIIYDAK